MSAKAVVFKDKVTIHVTAGNGGNGVASFRREKFVPRGGPDGGDGGHGGDVVLKASKDVDSLLPLYYQPHQRAEHGGHGKGKQLYGKRGPTLHVTVPCGTEVRDIESGEFLGEVIHHDDELLIAKGGKGGLGNIHFKSSTNQAPREFTEGTAGEQKSLELTLKIVADVGLVGYPNAGKSTLITALTDAHPKVAAYPFTTLHPIMGTLLFDNYRRIKIADIPGLIDGAHEGVGLGHDFLRHIERTRFLIFVIDMAGVDGRNPADDYKNLRSELNSYNAELNKLPYLIVANKMDEAAAGDNLPEFIQQTGEQPIACCAVLGEGIEAVRVKLEELCPS